MPRKPLSLQVTLGVAVSALILLLSLALAGVLGEIARQEVTGMAASHVGGLARQLARDLSQGMDGFSRDVQAQAERSIFRDPMARREDMRIALEQFAAGRPEFTYVGVADAATGRIIAAAGAVFEGGDMSGRPVFEEGKKGPYIGDLHEAGQLAELLPRPIDGEPLRVLDIAAPVRDVRGNASRVLVAHIGWQWADAMRESALGPLRDRHGIDILLLDGAGKVTLAPGGSVATGTPIGQLMRRPPPGDNAVTTMSAAAIAWSDGVDYLTAITPAMPYGLFPGLGWKVVARQPVAAAMAPATMLRQAIFAGALLLGLFAAGLGWVFTRRMLRPARRLGSASMLLSPASTPAPVAAMPTGRQGRAGESGSDAGMLRRLSSANKPLTNMASAARDPEFAALAESLPHIVWQADAGGTIEYRNAQWQQVFGQVRIERLDQLAALMHQADLLSFMQAWNGSRLSGEDLRCTVRLRIDGDRRYEWFSIQGRALRNEERHPVRWIGTITNVHETISQAERAESALANERAARSDAERVAEMKDEFLATLSHELRTPLNAIAGWAEILAQQQAQDDTVVRAAGVINRNVHLQAALIDDLLDTSAIIAGKITLERRTFDAAALAANVALSHKPAAEQKDIALEWDGDSRPIWIHADERRINQALTNLVSNAIKFTDAGGRISVRAALEEGMLALTIADSGSMAAGLRSPASQASPANSAPVRHHGGAGLGLAIAASLVKLHGGTVESGSVGKGSVFRMRLPALAAPDNGESGEPGDVGAVSDSTGQLLQRFPITPLAGLKILVIDDEEDARLAAQALLCSFGARVWVAASADDALALLDRQQFDLLICDIGMPGVDGYELMRVIRKRSRDKGAFIPAIALTAYAMSRDQRAAYQAGFDAHVSKPLSAQSLVETICTICEVDSQG